MQHFKIRFKHAPFEEWVRNNQKYIAAPSDHNLIENSSTKLPSINRNAVDSIKHCVRSYLNLILDPVTYIYIYN